MLYLWRNVSFILLFTWLKRIKCQVDNRSFYILFSLFVTIIFMTNRRYLKLYDLSHLVFSERNSILCKNPLGIDIVRADAFCGAHVAVDPSQILGEILSALPQFVPSIHSHQELAVEISETNTADIVTT